MRVVEDRKARSEDHRPVPLHQRCESKFGGRAIGVCKPLQKLPVGLITDRARIEKRFNELDKRPLTVPHERTILQKTNARWFRCTSDNVPQADDYSVFFVACRQIAIGVPGGLSELL
jgi:hypothetical protein